MEIIARVKEVFQKEIDEVIKVRDRVGIEVEKCIKMILKQKVKL